ncbi:MAG: phosphoglucomutase (alpha-D-glucose-1,6-bisphosphate-dependent) [Candidatus Binatia bacterium]|nr:phosphoglucomutase (alpha-D-glucose-1,6-bisphosphate-dependent) [Candidatus Binatia bacterium]
MALHKLAGKPAPQEILVNVPRLVTEYFSRRPDPSDPAQRVAFGTSGHRGCALDGSFNEAHVLAVSQALAEHRAEARVDGPLFIGIDTHALSEPALVSTVEVLAANGVEIVLEEGLGYTPTPVVSHAILQYNRGRTDHLADGVVITPSHNPPRDGGFKYNPPTGGPADEATTKKIEARANEILENDLEGVKRIPWARARALDSTRERNNIQPYVDDLKNVVDLECIAKAGLKLGVHPLGGAGLPVWEPIVETYGVDIDIVDRRVDPTFSFMTVDKDGKIRMDCSSPYAMASLVELKDRYDLAFGNDGDADRHGIVTKSAGLLNPNHVLAVAIRYLFETRTQWPAETAIGKTLVSSSMIDRVARLVKRPLAEVPVGFKWFVDGLLGGTFGFGGEESAGASFLRFDGTVWTTDKDGPVINLLMAEMTAGTGKDPAEHYRDLEEQFGSPVYERVDAPAAPAQKAKLKSLDASQVGATELAGEPIVAKLTRAPSNDAPIGGLKVVTENGWFAARPSGTEDVYKIYAESFLGAEHLARIQAEAQDLVDSVLQVEAA